MLAAASLVFAAECRAGAREDFEAGRKALSGGDFIAAKAGFDSALVTDSSFGKAIAAEWLAAARSAVSSGDLTGAAGLYAGAVALDKELGPKAGAEILAAADAISSEDERARVVHGAIAWAGAQKVAEATARWRAKTWGEPIEVTLETDGWAVFGEVGKGDRLVYVAPLPLTQRNGDIIRILPESPERTFELAVETPRAPLKLKKRDAPQTAYIWIFPAR